MYEMRVNNSEISRLFGDDATELGQYWRYQS